MWNFDAAQISAWVAQLWWPLLRIGGFIAVAPVMGSSSVPARGRIGLSLAIALLLAPLVQPAAAIEPLSAVGLVAAINQVLIGLAIGMTVSLVFDALALAGQTISMTMGLGYATLVDPQRGANTAVLGQMFTILGTLVYLSLDGHLALLAVFARSFQTIPVGAQLLDRHVFGTVASWGASVFESGLLIALPATVALLVVNLALGVVTRAAPQLNLFGVGFPIAMLAGYFVLISGLDSTISGTTHLLERALLAAGDLISARPLVR